LPKCGQILAFCPKIFWESRVTNGLSERSHSDTGVTGHTPIRIVRAGTVCDNV
jgi:hypothetical protein